MAKMSKTKRNSLPDSDFAGPGRSFPVNDRAHAKAAIMDSGSAPPAERAKIVSKAKKELAKTNKTKKPAAKKAKVKKYDPDGDNDMPTGMMY